MLQLWRLGHFELGFVVSTRGAAPHSRLPNAWIRGLGCARNHQYLVVWTFGGGAWWIPMPIRAGVCVGTDEAAPEAVPLSKSLSGSLRSDAREIVFNEQLWGDDSSCRVPTVLIAGE